MNARVHRLLFDGYVYSRLGILLNLLLNRDDCLFPVVLYFLEYN